MAKRVSQMGGTKSQVESYVGAPKQIVVDTQEWRPHVMDGTTPGGHAVALMSDLPEAGGNGNYATKEDLAGKVNVGEKVTSAREADHAAASDRARDADNAVHSEQSDKALADGAGNNIEATYARKDELTGGGGSIDTSNLATKDDLATKLDKNGKAMTAEVADSALADDKGRKISETYAELSLLGGGGPLATREEVTTGLAGKLDKSGVAVRAQADASGNDIEATYAKKSELGGGGGSAPSIDTSTFATKSALELGLAGKLDKEGKAKSAETADKATCDALGNVIATTYLKAGDSIDSAKNAKMAEKAIRDGYGNVITETYARKDTWGDRLADAVLYTSQSKNAGEKQQACINIGAVPRTGSRGKLAGWDVGETHSQTETYGTQSSDTTHVYTSGAVELSFSPPVGTDHAVKVIQLRAQKETTLKLAGAVWASGTPPTWGTQDRELTLVAHFIDQRVVVSPIFNNEGAV